MQVSLPKLSVRGRCGSERVRVLAPTSDAICRELLIVRAIHLPQDASPRPARKKRIGRFQKRQPAVFKPAHKHEMKWNNAVATIAPPQRALQPSKPSGPPSVSPGWHP